MSALNWRFEDDKYIITLRNARGSGNPPDRPYRLLVLDKQRRPVFSAWMSKSALASLTSQLSREMGIRPISDIIMGDKPVGT